MTESLALGLETVAKNPLLLLLPLIIDVFLWLGPRLSFRPLINTLSHSIDSLNPLSLTSALLVLNLGFPVWSHQQIWDPLVPSLAEISEGSTSDVTRDLESLSQSAPDQYLNVLMPSMVAGHDAKSLPFDYIPPVWQIQTPFEAAALRMGLFLIGLVFWTIYLAIVSQWVREGQTNIGWIARRVPLILLQLVFVLIMVGVAIFMLALVLSAVEMLSSLVGITGIAGFLLLLVILVGSWVAMFAAFTLHGMYMNDRNVFTAAWDSLRVVQWNVSSTMGLILVILILLTAMQYIKGWLDAGSWLMAVGIAANAFLCTGLLAATFVFFKDRYRYWRELREELLAELERRRTEKSKSS